MFSNRIDGLTPYTPGEQPSPGEFVKLNTNENPYPPTPRIQEFLNSFDISRLRLYPDPSSTQLREVIARAKGVPGDHVFIGNSSDEVISFAFYAFFDGARGNLLFPRFTYTFYPVYSDYYSIPYRQIALSDDFSIDLENYLGLTSCGVILPNPNAPTGVALSRGEIRSFLKKFDSDRVVIIDEAYVDFGAESSIPLVAEFPNLLVIHTFSKGYSLAALRLGYAVGQPRLIAALSKVKNSFNSYPVDIFAQNIGIIAIEDSEYHSGVISRIVETRKLFSRTIVEMGWAPLESQANFIFTKKEGISGREIYLKLRNLGFLVRYFDIIGIREFVRITVGTDEEMEALVGALQKIE